MSDNMLQSTNGGRGRGVKTAEKQIISALRVKICQALKAIYLPNHKNIAGRSPENSRNSFVELQSQKNRKKDRPKNSSFHWRLICYIFIKNLCKFLLPLLADLKQPPFRVTHTHLTLSLWIKVNKRQFQSEEVIFESEVSQMWPNI